MNNFSMKKPGLGCLLTFILIILVCCMSFATAETEIPYRLPFDPADTWEEAKMLDLEITYINEEPESTWFLIAYNTPDMKEADVFYRSSTGRFSWAEIQANQFFTLPEDREIWGFFRYDAEGRMTDCYFCEEMETGSSLYCFYDTYMNPTRLEYYYKEADIEERLEFDYYYRTQEWSYSDGIPDMPFDGDELVASVYHPEIRIVRTPPEDLPEDLELTFTQPDRANYKPIVAENPKGFLMDSYLMPISLNNEELFREICSTPPVFSCVQVSGPDTAVYIADDDVIRLIGTQSEPCELLYEVTATWGDYTATTHFSIVFFQCELPETIGFDTDITLRVGETVRLSVNYDDGAWPYRKWRGVYVTDYDSSVYNSEGNLIIGWWNEEFKTDEDSGNHVWIEAYRPGTARIYVNTNQDGLAWDGAVTITVLEEENLDTLMLPGDLQAIDAEAFLGSKAQKVILPQGCKQIGDKAFAYMNELTEIVIPDSVVEFADDFLVGSDQVTIVTSEGSPAYLWALENHVPVTTE